MTGDDKTVLLSLIFFMVGPCFAICPLLSFFFSMERFPKKPGHGGYIYLNTQQLSLGFPGSLLPRPPRDTLRAGREQWEKKSLQSCSTRQLARIA